MLVWLSTRFPDFINVYRTVGVVDVVDILLLAGLLYGICHMLRGRRSERIATGLLCVLAVLTVFSATGMQSMRYLLSGVTVLALFVLFQSELRMILERIGNLILWSINPKTRRIVIPAKTEADEICKAVFHMANAKTGAIIAIGDDIKDEDVVTPGVLLDANISKKLIENLFFNKAPLHDGAVIIKEGRVFSAGNYCYLTSDERVIGGLGSRHRAAVGLSERCNALVIVVSEETGVVSVAAKGQLIRNYTYEKLHDLLEEVLDIRKTSPADLIRLNAKRRGRILRGILTAAICLLLSVIFFGCIKGMML